MSMCGGVANAGGSMPGHVLIGGGTGFIGKHLSETLKNRGFGVTIISRKPVKNGITWENVRKVGIPVETTHIVNLAGHNIMDMSRRWSESFKKDVWNSRILSINTLSESIAQGIAPVKAFMVVSGVGIYDPAGNNIYAEDSRVRDFDFISKLCIEIEKASKIPSHLNCRQIVIRCGVVLGKDGGMIKNMYLPFSLGLGGPVRPGYQPLPWIHVKDISRLMSFALEQPNVSGVINGVAPQIITNNDFAKAFGSALSRPAIIPIPETLLNMMLNAERAKMLTTGPKVTPKRATALGFNFTYPDIKSACQSLMNEPATTPF